MEDLPGPVHRTLADHPEVKSVAWTWHDDVTVVWSRLGVG